jgi:hypothetical protein
MILKGLGERAQEQARKLELAHLRASLRQAETLTFNRVVIAIFPWLVAARWSSGGGLVPRFRELSASSQ